jgi:predicted RNA binding protein YcfA (HicA-like mRNA interferase family)
MLYPTKSLQDYLGGLGYKYKEEDRRHKLLKNSQTSRYAVLPQRDHIDEQTVRQILRQAGEDQNTVDRFLGQASAQP